METNQMLLMIATTITALTVIFVGIRKVTFVVRKIIHFLDDYFGEEPRPGFEGRPGMQERLRKMEEEMRTISYEMKPNSGSSIKDAIGRIETRLAHLEEKSGK